MLWVLFLCFICKCLSISDADQELALPFYDKAAAELIGIVGNKAFFKDITNTTVNFLDYVQFCQSNQMQTAEINSEEENKLIFDYIQSGGFSNLWLGGWDINRDSKDFSWITGNPVVYTNWVEGYPNDEVNRHCMVLFKDGWADLLCNLDYSYTSLCQLSLV